MENTKYHAYFRPSNTPCVMDNIENILMSDLTLANYKNSYRQIYDNIEFNDWQHLNINANNKHKNIGNKALLVLVKFTNVNKLFTCNWDT